MTLSPVSHPSVPRSAIQPPKQLNPEFTTRLHARMATMNLPARFDLIAHLYPHAKHVTRFALADQVLKLAFAEFGHGFPILADTQLLARPQLRSLIDITKARFGTEIGRVDAPMRGGAVIGDDRDNCELVAFDERFGTIVFHPLADWSEAALVDTVLAAELPVDPLEFFHMQAKVGRSASARGHAA